jgi:late competence protein required for DNA uptake (superfamily II DNA/RNA helicase)
MDTRTNFRCHKCGKHHYTKQNLLLCEGHLYCQSCLDTMPVVLPTIFGLEYLTKRGLLKKTALKVPTIEEARAYAIEKLKAHEIIVLEKIQG